MSALGETFAAYVAAESAATSAFIAYRSFNVSEREVHRLQAIAAEARAAHLAAIDAAVSS